MINPLQGYFVGHFDRKWDHKCQVWLKFQINGKVTFSTCVWEKEYTKETAGIVRGEQEAYLLLFRQVAHTLNTGIDCDEMWTTLYDGLPKDMPAIKLPEPWFYWSSTFDCENENILDPVCTHYFVQPDSDECLVWQTNCYIEIVDGDSVGIHWREVEAMSNRAFEEAAADAKEVTEG